MTEEHERQSDGSADEAEPVDPRRHAWRTKVIVVAAVLAAVYLWKPAMKAVAFVALLMDGMSPGFAWKWVLNRILAPSAYLLVQPVAALYILMPPAGRSRPVLAAVLFALLLLPAAGALRAPGGPGWTVVHNYCDVLPAFVAVAGLAAATVVRARWPLVLLIAGAAIAQLVWVDSFIPADRDWAYHIQVLLSMPEVVAIPGAVALLWLLVTEPKEGEG